VLLNLTSTQGHAVVFHEGATDAVELHGVNDDTVGEQLGSLRAALHQRNRRFQTVRLRGVLEWCWDRVMAPVLERCGFQSPGAGKAPDLWLCPAGVMSGLPLQAAGVGGDGPVGVLDFVCPSYLPSLVLLHPDAAVPLASPERFLVVGIEAYPESRNLTDMPRVAEEVSALVSLYPRARVLSGAPDDRGEVALVEDVAAALALSDWAHFACHARAESDGTFSGIELVDGRLTVARLHAMRRGHHTLAFLSACETAVLDELVPHESLNLAAAFQFAGYRHVIGTLWPVSDPFAPSMATEFYRLVADHDPGQALRLAVMQARRGEPNPFFWAGYGHFGS